MEFCIDFFNRRAMTINGADSSFTLTTMNDLANIVARAIEYSGEWPTIGGIKGSIVSTSKLIDIGVKVRGTETIFLIMENDKRTDCLWI